MNTFHSYVMWGALGLLVSLTPASAQEKTALSLSVEELFRLAGENSKSIQVYRTGVEQAEQAVKVAKNAQLPTIDVSASASYLGNAKVIDRDFTNWTKAAMPHFGNNFSLEASQVIYAGGAVQGGIEVAKLQERLENLAREGNEQDVRFMILSYYLELYKLNNQRNVYLKNIDQTNMVIAQIQAKQREGMALHNDITRYELQLKNLELALINVNNSCAIFNNELTSTLGLPSTVEIQPDTTLLSMVIPVSKEEKWVEEAIFSKPGLQQSELQIELCKKQEKITRAEWLPKVALVASGIVDGPITIEIPTINKNLAYWYVGVGVRYNLASLYTTGKKQRMNKLATRKAHESYALAMENVEVAVQSAHIRLKESFEQLRTQQKSVELATQNYDVVNNRYNNDLALLTDMLDASNTKLSAELQFVNLQINTIYSYYKLQHTAGVLK